MESHQWNKGFLLEKNVSEINRKLTSILASGKV